MSVLINTKKKIPEEKQTKIKVLSIAQVRGCFPEVKALYEKYERLYKENPMDYYSNFHMAKGLIQDLSNIDIYLVAWLANEQGQILINNTVAFVLEDVPDEKL